jgi:uncharacterized FlgJ-related protein
LPNQYQKQHKRNKNQRNLTALAVDVDAITIIITQMIVATIEVDMFKVWEITPQRSSAKAFLSEMKANTSLGSSITEFKKARDLS